MSIVDFIIVLVMAFVSSVLILSVVSMTNPISILINSIKGFKQLGLFVYALSQVKLPSVRRWPYPPQPFCLFLFLLWWVMIILVFVLSIPFQIWGHYCKKHINHIGPFHKCTEDCENYGSNESR